MERKKNILIISPAGRVYEHDRVEWYPNPFSTIKADYFNIGDMVVHDSTLKLLDYKRVEGVVIERLDEGLIEWYKTFDCVLVRASNFIHNDMDWGFGLEVIRRLNLPVYVVGVGAQSNGRGDYLLNDHNLAFWREVSSRCKTIGVRGDFTAALLAKNGIKNVDVVGCPTVFRTRNRGLKIAQPTTPQNVAFSVRREVDATYSADISSYLSVQRNILLSVVDKFNTTITIHGEPEEKAFYYHDLPAQASAVLKFLKEGWWTEDTKVRMMDLYLNRLFFFLKVEDYDEFIVSQDLAIGYRVHGVLPALANGVAGFLLTYDSRSGELANTHKIPSYSVGTEDVDIVDIVGNIDYGRFNSEYSLGYDRMKRFLDVNGLDNRM